MFETTFSLNTFLFYYLLAGLALAIYVAVSIRIREGELPGNEMEAILVFFTIILVGWPIFIFMVLQMTEELTGFPLFPKTKKHLKLAREDANKLRAAMRELEDTLEERFEQRLEEALKERGPEAMKAELECKDEEIRDLQMREEAYKASLQKDGGFRRVLVDEKKLPDWFLHLWVRHGTRTFKLKKLNGGYPKFRFSEELFDGADPEEFYATEPDRMPFFIGSMGIWPSVREHLKEGEELVGVVRGQSPFSGIAGDEKVVRFTGPSKWEPIYDGLGSFKSKPALGAYHGVLNNASGHPMPVTFCVVEEEGVRKVVMDHNHFTVEVPKSGGGWVEHQYIQSGPGCDAFYVEHSIWVAFYKKELLWKEEQVVLYANGSSAHISNGTLRSKKLRIGVLKWVGAEE